MPTAAIDVLDSTWIKARAATVGAVIADPGNWRRWWPGLDLHADELRGEQGVRWTVRGVAEHPDLALRGSAEIWLQPADDGVIVHFFLKLDPTPPREVPLPVAERMHRTYRRLAKRAFWAVADQLDPQRFTRHTSASHTTIV